MRRSAYRVTQRILDVVISVVLLVGSAPILLAAAAAIRWTGPGPVGFRQRRAGRNGRPFTMYKLRSMYPGAEDQRVELSDGNDLEEGPCFKLYNDPRITPVGRFLRQTSIDELPQLLNVLKGDMTLVGPRPLPLEEIRHDSEAERIRLSVQPGITCLWQISGRSEIPYSEWILLDLYYIANRSLLLDLLIIIKTIPAVLSRRGAM